MMRIKNSLKSLLAVAALTVAGPVLAAGGGAMPYTFKADPGNEASVQRGARNFMNYCSGCHSMRLMRYNRIGQDLGISEELLQANLMFTSSNPGDHIISAMTAERATASFGAPAPDLTVETRYRGADWVYNYLMTFYVDPARPLGTNNLMLPGASMPHVLGSLQGVQVKHVAEHAEGDAHGAHAMPSFEVVQAGTLSAADYKKFVADTVNFMVYAAEPGRAHRISTGLKVMVFLLIFTFIAYLMKREFWKDVH